MKLSANQSYFTFTKSQRRGIFALLALIITIQALYFVVDFDGLTPPSPENQQWLALQSEIDSLKSEQRNAKPTIYPFNPNFITDFKGYRLGMSVAEIDRLHQFRKLNKYVNSAAEFQSVTKVSDSLLLSISPYFKFPDWVTNKQQSQTKYKAYEPYKKEKPKPKDINLATADDLIKVYGIGAALSERILKQREILGGFVNIDQVADVWGLSDEVVASVKQQFYVSAIPDVKKIAINNATIKELSAFPYFRYALAKQIVTYRSMNGDIKGSADLRKIPSFPIEKAEIIALYLEF